MEKLLFGDHLIAGTHKSIDGGLLCIRSLKCHSDMTAMCKSVADKIAECGRNFSRTMRFAYPHPAYGRPRPELRRFWYGFAGSENYWTLHDEKGDRNPQPDLHKVA